MTKFSDVERLRRQADKLRHSNILQVRTELTVFFNALLSDEKTRLILDGLWEREQNDLDEYAPLFCNGLGFERVVTLPFIRTQEQQAAFGYQILRGLAYKLGLNAEDVGGIVVRVGEKYVQIKASNKQIEVGNAIACWVDRFIDPIIDYLDGAYRFEDLAVALMVKYKHRCEWFESRNLLEIVSNEKNEDEESIRRQVEKKLKTDFYRYLFDSGVDFVVEPKSPKGGGEPDVMTARFLDGRLLIVEAKVYDGLNRGKAWVRSGIAQASSYAEEWGEPYAYLLVYNVVKDSKLDFSNTNKLDNFSVDRTHTPEVRILVVNLNNAKPASKANELTSHTI